MPKPRITAEQETALNENHGLIQAEGQGGDVLLMRAAVVLDWFGYTQDELQKKLIPAIEQADRGDASPWNLNDFLDDMHNKHDAKSN